MNMTCATGTASWPGQSYADLLRSMAEIKARLGTLRLGRIDCIVTSRAGLDIVVKTIGLSDIERGNWLDDKLFGIPVMSYEVQREARTKALELHVIERKRVIYIDDGGNCLLLDGDLGGKSSWIPELANAS